MEIFIHYLGRVPEFKWELRVLLEEMQRDEAQLEDAFYKNLEFGTGGMRGKSERERTG